MIRATIVLLAAHAIVPRLRRASAADRHLIWTAVVAMAAILPALAVVLPAWRPTWVSGLAEAFPSLATLPSWALPGSPDVVLRATQVESGPWANVDWFGAIWILGSLVALLRLGVEVVKLRRLLATSRPVTDSNSLRVLRQTAQALGAGCAPQLLASPHAVIPLTWGVRRPQILLPEAACEWEEERLRAVLGHELAHIRRADWLVHVLVQVACAAYWFHPLFWMAERALCRESEHAADDEVLGLGVDGSAYAAQLLAIVRAARTSLPARRTVVAMARTSHLERRVSALLNASANRRSRSRRAVAAAGAIAFVMTPPLAAMTIGGAAGLHMDVVVQMLNLPPAAPIADVRGPDPARPAVRNVRSAAGAAPNASIVAPAILEYTTPALYSDLARQRRTEGVVTVALRVDEHGSVSGARVVKGLGDGLDQNALVAVRQWRFLPGTIDSGPVAMDVEVDIEFDLRTEAINELIANDMVTLVGPGITPPRVVRTMDLPSRAAGARGTVVLDVVLLENGSPKILRILQSLSPEADESAIRHFEQWRFSPAMRNGAPVKVRMNAEVRFYG